MTWCGMGESWAAQDCGASPASPCEDGTSKAAKASSWRSPAALSTSPLIGGSPLLEHGSPGEQAGVAGSAPAQQEDLGWVRLSGAAPT